MDRDKRDVSTGSSFCVRRLRRRPPILRPMMQREEVRGGLWWQHGVRPALLLAKFSSQSERAPISASKRGRFISLPINFQQVGCQHLPEAGFSKQHGMVWGWLVIRHVAALL